MKFRYLALGGCTLNNPLSNLARRKLATSVFAEMGFRKSPFSLSSGGAVQLIRFCSGKLDIPKWIRELCYGDPNHVPTPAQSAKAGGADVVLIEMSTPVEYVYEGFILNQNRFKESILTPLRASNPVVKRMANRWLGEGLQKQNEELRVKYSTALLEVLPRDSEEQCRLRDVVQHTHGRHVRAAEMYPSLREVVETLNKPAVIVLFNYSYMPDGRPVIWPSDFKDNSRAVAERLGLPCYDPADIVERHWSNHVLMDDGRHYARGFEMVVADEYLNLVQVLVPSLILGSGFDGRDAA